MSPREQALAGSFGREEEAGSFEELFRLHYARIARLIYRVVGNQGQAEELAAEVFWKLHRKPPADFDHLEGWLTRTALRMALDRLRAEGRRSWYETLVPKPPPAPNPEQLIEKDQDCRRVRIILARLKSREAELLLLRADGASYQEISAALELNFASVGTILARAQKNFRKEFEERYGTR